MKRREFIQTTAGIASGMLLLKPRSAFGYQANSAVRHGLLGCGNRGTHVAASFSQNTVAQVVALADLFPNQLEEGRAHFNQVNAALGVSPSIPDSPFMAHMRLSSSLLHPILT